MADMDQKAIVQRMIDAGESEENIATVIQHFKTKAAAPAPEGAVSRFVSGAAKNLNPMGVVNAVEHPVDTAKALLEAHKAQFDKAKAAYDDGHYSEAIGHLGAAALPILGPAAANAGERIGSGDVAGGLGEATGLLASVAAPRAIPAAVRGAGAAGDAVADVAKAGARGAGRVATAAADALDAHPAIGATVGGVVGYHAGGVMGALEGAATGARGVRIFRVVQKLAAAGKTPALADIAEEVSKTPADAPEAPMPAGEPPPPGKSPQQVANEAAVAARRAQPTGSALGARGPAAVTPEALIDSLKHLDPTDYRPGATVPSGEGSVAGDVMRQQSREVDLTRHQMPVTDVRHAELMKSFGGTQTPAPVPLSKAVATVQQAATEAKIKLTATEFTEATRLATHGHPGMNVVDAVVVQRALRSSSTFGKLPTDAEVRADFGVQARAGKKSLMGEYGDEPPPTGNPFR